MVSEAQLFNRSQWMMNRCTCMQSWKTHFVVYDDSSLPAKIEAPECHLKPAVLQYQSLTSSRMQTLLEPSSWFNIWTWFRHHLACSPAARHKLLVCFLCTAALQHAASYDWTSDPGLPHYDHQSVVLPGSVQHHHLPLWLPPAIAALPWVPRLPPPQVSRWSVLQKVCCQKVTVSVLNVCCKSSLYIHGLWCFVSGLSACYYGHKYQTKELNKPS